MLAAYMKDWKLAAKNLLASQHCDSVFDFICAQIFIQQKKKDKAIEYLKDSIMNFPQNSMLLSTLSTLEPHDYAFRFWKVIYAQGINLDLDPSLCPIENVQEAFIWTIAQIESDFNNESAWQLLESLLPLHSDCINFQFILPEWNAKLQNPHFIPPKTLAVITSCLKIIFPSQ